MRRQLDHFYQSTDQYTPFDQVSDQSSCWAWVYQRILELSEQAERPIQVLEFGAGRTGFMRHLPRHLRDRMRFVAQDVTDANREFLEQEADEVVIGDIAEVAGSMDVIFSTYVWEHISNPVATLERLLDMLRPGGSLFLFCPRYDVPLYIPPVLRHLSKSSQHAATGRLMLARMRTRIGGRGLFGIVTEPAVLGQTQWFRDADAIHLVSLNDLRQHLASRATVRRLDADLSWVQRRLQLRVEITPLLR